MNIILDDNPEFNRLNIEARYSRGGMNDFSNKPERRGVYIHVNPVSISKTQSGTQVVTAMPMGEGSFKILAQELGRKSEKRVERIQNQIDALPAKELKHLWETGYYQQLAQKIQEAVTLKPHLRAKRF